MVWLSSSQYRLAPLPGPDDLPPSPPGSSGNGALANVTPDTLFEGQATEIQRRSTATLPPNTDLIRPTKTCELHQRPA
jgi:hypothetical protein